MTMNLIIALAILGSSPDWVAVRTGGGLMLQSMKKTGMDRGGIHAPFVTVDLVAFMPIYRSFKVPWLLLRGKVAYGKADEYDWNDEEYKFVYAADTYFSTDLEARLLLPLLIPAGPRDIGAGYYYTAQPFVGAVLHYESGYLELPSSLMRGYSCGIRSELRWLDDTLWGAISSLGFEMALTLLESMDDPHRIPMQIHFLTFVGFSF